MTQPSSKRLVTEASLVLSQASFVKFVDLNGNPIPGHVQIKVDTTTGEINDITYVGA